MIVYSHLECSRNNLEILRWLEAVWPDWAIFCTLVNHSKLVATIILPKLTTLLGNFYKGVKIIHFSIEIIYGQLLLTMGDFYLVTLPCPEGSFIYLECKLLLCYCPFREMRYIYLRSSNCRSNLYVWCRYVHAGLPVFQFIGMMYRLTYLCFH